MFPLKRHPTLQTTAFPTKLWEAQKRDLLSYQGPICSGFFRPQIPLPEKPPLASTCPAPVKQNKHRSHVSGMKVGFSFQIYKQKTEWHFKWPGWSIYFFSHSWKLQENIYPLYIDIYINIYQIYIYISQM